MYDNDSSSFGWLLNSFVEETTGVDHALAVSADGIKLAASDGLSSQVADQFAAIASGLASLTHGAARCFGEDGVDRLMIEMTNSYLVIGTINEGAVLGVLTGKDQDLGLVVYEMTLFTDRAGRVLTPALIDELKNTLRV
ncbi:MAG: roadblock/LC7 domain-containing protein [Actinomycetota bacterium]